MMLISPLAAYSVGKGHEFIRQAAFDITSLIHPDETVKLCNTFYVTCMTILIENPKVSRIDAYNQTKEIVKTDNVTFKQWIQEIEDPKQRIPTYPKGGWVRIAFTHSFAIFLEGLSYKESIAKMLMLRGDTDTNGCILGALVGIN
jgi:ADP-ribosylglycohydrolase